jgi:hypothetical protein
MSGLDDYMIHNSPFPVRVMWTSDPRAYERVYFSAIDSTGQLLVVVGLGFYPNLGTADGFAIVNRSGSHTTVRGHRLLGDDRMDMSLGPIKLEVVEPFKQWKLSLAENEYGVSFELDWFDTKRASYRDYGDMVKNLSMGRPRAGYETLGRVQGWVKVGDETITLDRETSAGSRDHHWGARKGVGGKGAGPSAFPEVNDHYHSGEFVDFSDWAIFADNVFYNLGDSRRSCPVRKGERALRIDPKTKLLLGGEATITLETGEQKFYKFDTVPGMTAFLRCGMYGGFAGRGGTPGTDIWHGQYVGDMVVTGETIDVTDPATQWELSGLDDAVARFECDGEVTFGITETETAVLLDGIKLGARGLSLLSD